MPGAASLRAQRPKPSQEELLLQGLGGVKPTISPAEQYLAPAAEKSGEEVTIGDLLPQGSLGITATTDSTAAGSSSSASMALHGRKRGDDEAEEGARAGRQANLASRPTTAPASLPSFSSGDPFGANQPQLFSTIELDATIEREQAQLEELRRSPEEHEMRHKERLNFNAASALPATDLPSLGFASGSGGKDEYEPYSIMGMRNLWWDGAGSSAAPAASTTSAYAYAAAVAASSTQRGTTDSYSVEPPPPPLPPSSLYLPPDVDGPPPQSSFTSSNEAPRSPRHDHSARPQKRQLADRERFALTRRMKKAVERVMPHQPHFPL